MRLYIAGPMTGIPQFNYPAFIEAAAALRTEGWDITCPAELDDADTKRKAMASMDGSLADGDWNGDTWGDFLSRDVKLIADTVDGVALLHGWGDSRGACLEAFVALLDNKPLYEYFEHTVHPLCSKEAMTIINRRVEKINESIL